MTIFLTTLWRILILQAPASAIPRSGLLLVLALLMNIVVSAAFYQLPTTAEKTPPALLLLVSLATLVFYVLILNIRGHGMRAEQVLTAIVGVDALLTFVLLVSVAIGGEADNPVFLLVVLWTVVVRGKIIAEGMDWPWLAGSAFELALLSVTFRIFVATQVEPVSNTLNSAASFGGA